MNARPYPKGEEPPKLYDTLPRHAAAYPEPSEHEAFACTHRVWPRTPQGQDFHLGYLEGYQDGTEHQRSKSLCHIVAAWCVAALAVASAAVLVFYPPGA